jgi:hypothetical protein
MATTRRQKPLVKVVFDGVMAVGPGHPEQGTREGPFFGVMAQATRRLSDRSRRLRRRAKASGGRKKVQERDLYTPIHVPTIFTLLEPTNDSRPPDQVLQLSPFHPKWYLWHPIRERLEFRFDGDGTPGTLEYLRGPVPTSYREKHSPVLLHGIENIPDLRTIWPDRSVLLDGLLSADPGVSDRVATQVLVPYGTVAGAGTLDRGLPLDVVFDPVRKLRSHRSLVPNAAVLVNANRIEIASYSLDSGDRLDSIKLRATRNAEIYVSNGDPSDVELDTKKLAIEIVRRLFGGKVRFDKLPEEAKSFAASVRDELRLENDDQFFRVLELLNHGAATTVVEGLAIHPRAGNVDVDFELYYHLMKNEHLTRDGKGLPIPRRPRKYDKFQGPNCYIAGCETQDRLYFKSQRPKPKPR